MSFRESNPAFTLVGCVLSDERKPNLYAPACVTGTMVSLSSAETVISAARSTPELAVTLAVTTLEATVTVHQLAEDLAVTAPVDVAVMVFPVVSAAFVKSNEVGATVSLFFF